MCGATAAPTWMWRSVSSRAGRCTAASLPAVSSIPEHLVLQLVIDRLRAEPDGEEGIGEVLAGDGDLVRGGRLHDGALSGNVGDGDPLAGAQIRNRFQELIESRLQLRHLRPRVLLESGL